MSSSQPLRSHSRHNSHSYGSFYQQSPYSDITSAKMKSSSNTPSTTIDVMKEFYGIEAGTSFGKHLSEQRSARIRASSGALDGNRVISLPITRSFFNENARVYATIDSELTFDRNDLSKDPSNCSPASGSLCARRV